MPAGCEDRVEQPQVGRLIVDGQYRSPAMSIKLARPLRKRFDLAG